MHMQVHAQAHKHEGDKQQTVTHTLTQLPLDIWQQQVVSKHLLEF